MRMRRLALVLLVALVTLVPGVGCARQTLETGYKFTPLGASPTQRRAYYAGPFSPEARQAQMEAASDESDRRPRPGM